MKKIICILGILLATASCQVEGELTDGGISDALIPVNEPQYEGIFMPTSGISVTGEAKIYFDNGQHKVVLNNFSVSSGPDLKVYLSKSDTPDSFVNLGNLTSQTSYNIPATVDIANYTHVLIHCQQYNHLFAIAPLTQN